MSSSLLSPLLPSASSSPGTPQRHHETAFDADEWTQYESTVSTSDGTIEVSGYDTWWGGRKYGSLHVQLARLSLAASSSGFAPPNLQTITKI